MSGPGPAAAAAPPVVAIDGPAGVGKSTTARLVAAELSLPYLDTGAMYRAVALAALDRGIDPADDDALSSLAPGLDLRLELQPDGRVSVLLDGSPVEGRIRSQEAGEAASHVAALPAVRARLVELQRAFGERHGAVLEGRDIGSVVFPRTPHKFFLDARPEVRARRRGEQLRGRGEAGDEREVAAEISRRDRRDRERSASPLRCDETYQRIDTSDLSIDEVVAAITKLVRGAGRGEGTEKGTRHFSPGEE